MEPSVLYWKWDDSHLKEKDKYIKQIDDITSRSVFSHIYITTHWCHSGISTQEMKNHIAKATDYIHEKGRKIVFEIDARAEKAKFCKENPDKRIGFTFNKKVTTNTFGKASIDFKLKDCGNGELFLGDSFAYGEVLKCVSIDSAGKSSANDCLCSTNKNNQSGNSYFDCSFTVSQSNDIFSVSIDDLAYKNKEIFVLVCFYLNFPDINSREFKEFFLTLINFYSDIKIDGVALDEFSYPWHPDFNFNPSGYTIWDSSPLYGKDFAEDYKKRYGTDYITDVLNRFLKNDDTAEKLVAINRYFEFVRTNVADIEKMFYDSAKKTFGESAFVAAHPTWYAIEEVDNTPEVWKNAIDWFDVPRDYGFTDEIMIYPVRFGLMRKAKSHTFYNMWYSEATGDITTYYEEMWRNVRFGGRTISLGYECVNEKGIVLELKEKGYLENISEIEKRIQKLDEVQKFGVKSDILIITGIESSCNRVHNQNSNGGWHSLKSTFKNSFILARDIFNMGYNCDYTLNYEVYNKNIFVNSRGYVQYGNQEYKYVIFYDMQFSKPIISDFINNCKKCNSGITIIGKTDKDFNAKPLNISSDYNFRIDALDLIPLFEEYSVQKNRVPLGTELTDGSIILTAPYPNKPYGNYFKGKFNRGGKTFEVDGEDFIYISFDDSGNINLKIDGKTI